MNEDLYALLPTLQQRLATLALTSAGAAFIVWLVWRRRLREEHALLWFLGLLVGTIVVWSDPLLVLFTRSLGIDLPAHALILVVLFFLLGMCVWLSSTASRNKRRIEKLIIQISILRSQLDETTVNERNSTQNTPGA